MRSSVASLALLLVAGCASLDSPYRALPAATDLARSDATGECLRRLQSFDSDIDAAALRDVQATPVPGYPYLRADRFSVRSESGSQPEAGIARARVERMAALDAEAREYEMKNLGLPPSEREKLERCQRELAATAQEDAQHAAAAAVVPDDYSEAMRIVGIYPLAQIPFSAGVADWQNSVLEGFRKPWPQVPVEGQRQRYTLVARSESADVAGLLPGAPALGSARAWQLLQQHAPVIIVDTVSDDDRIGALTWRDLSGAERITVDVRDPALYARIAWTEIAGNARLQLVYTLWFPARTARSAFDLEAGPLDGLIWRITLDDQYRPLVYDSIHPCGCFHMFFPTEGIRTRSDIAGQGRFDERLLLPQSLRSPDTNERIAVYVTARTHQIQRVAIEAQGAEPGRGYRLLDENLLRALPRASGTGATRSAYGPDALVAGSERAERWFYWPMGIPSAGQMRQWGHHSTAFVGRRHFDDPLLIERYFVVVPRDGSG